MSLEKIPTWQDVQDWVNDNFNHYTDSDAQDAFPSSTHSTSNSRYIEGAYWEHAEEGTFGITWDQEEELPLFNGKGSNLIDAVKIDLYWDGVEDHSQRDPHKFWGDLEIGIYDIEAGWSGEYETTTLSWNQSDELTGLTDTEYIYFNDKFLAGDNIQAYFNFDAESDFFEGDSYSNRDREWQLTFSPRLVVNESHDHSL